MIRALQLSIRGMTCAACAQASERAVKKLPGIEEAAVNFATERLLVKFEDGKLSIEEIKKAVEKAGYEAVEDSLAKEATIPVGGMTCAACAKAIERAVGKLPGVESVAVNLATERAQVRWDGALLRLSEIKEAIRSAGYEPLALDSGAKVDEHQKAKERETRLLWTNFAVSAFFSIPLLYVAMGAMLGLPIPASLAPMQYPLSYALFQIALQPLRALAAPRPGARP